MEASGQLGPAGATLAILAHQDDEIAVASRILRDHRQGRRVYCCFLTDGSGAGSDPAVRDAESSRVLGRMGVAESDVFFIGSKRAIPDGSLYRNLDRAYEHAEELCRSISFDEILCPYWEGGHHDHDASHLIALAIARRFRLAGNVRQFPLYNGDRTSGGLFHVMSPIPGPSIERRRISFSDGLRIVSLCFRYPSQRRSWLGLLPGVFAQLVVARREVSATADPHRVRERPHAGKLFYERRYGVAWEDFHRATEDFVRRRIAP